MIVRWRNDLSVGCLDRDVYDWYEDIKCHDVVAISTNWQLNILRLKHVNGAINIEKLEIADDEFGWKTLETYLINEFGVFTTQRGESVVDLLNVTNNDIDICEKLLIAQSKKKKGLLGVKESTPVFETGRYGFESYSKHQGSMV